jgi:DNA gyrase subunit A
MGREARGVRGIALREGDALVALATVPRDSDLSLLTVCERGHGKRTKLAEYPTKNRGGMGVITIRTSERNGKVVAVRVVSDDDDLILITDKGKLIRVPVSNLRVSGRNTQGVRIMRVDEGEKISAVERLADPEDKTAIEAAPAPAEAAETEEPIVDEPEADADADAEAEPDDGEGEVDGEVDEDPDDQEDA